MKNRKLKYSFVYDAPVTLSFCIISILFFVLNIIFKAKLSNLILSSPTTKSGALVFDPASALSYFRLVFYSFGAPNANRLFFNLVFILMLGPSMEDRYGSIIIGLMMFVSTIFSGVLNACFRELSLNSCDSILFMMILLNCFLMLSKKKIAISAFAIFIFFICFLLSSDVGLDFICLLINFTGGLCGSLFAFLSSSKTENKKDSENTTGKRNFRLPGKKGEGLLKRLSKKKDLEKTVVASDDTTVEETVIGSLKF